LKSGSTVNTGCW